jgi:uncharacterized delta-60 repeat protein
MRITAITFRAVGAALLLFQCARAVLAEGPLDPSFGEGTPPYGPTGVFDYEWSTKPASPVGMVQDDKGRLIVAASYANQICVSRQREDGYCDSQFGNNGFSTDFVHVDSNNQAWASAVAIDHQNRIVIGGGVNSTDSCGDGDGGSYRGLVILRVLDGSGADGKADSSFGTFGISYYGDCTFSTDAAADIAIGADDTIVTIGSKYSSSTAAALLVKWKADGNLDENFGGSGSVVYAAAEHGRSLTIDSQGRIVAALERYDGLGLHGSLVRFTPLGDLDTTFGVDGIVDLGDLSDKSSLAYANVCCVRLDSAGRIVVAAQTASSPTGSLHTELMVARFSEDGLPDPTFGTRGNVLFDGNRFISISKLSIDAHDRPIIGGTLKSPYSAVVSPVVLQLNLDGTLNTAAGFGGLFSNEYGFYSLLSSMMAERNGRIVIGAVDYLTDNTALMRYDQVYADGFD